MNLRLRISQTGRCCLVGVWCAMFGFSAPPLSAQSIRKSVEGYVYVQQQPGTVPLYRYWNATTRASFYTTNSSEGKFARTHGYKFKGITGYVFRQRRIGTVPLYRYWNERSGSHFYTRNKSEGSRAQARGCKFERIEGYMCEQQRTGTVPFYRSWAEPSGPAFNPLDTDAAMTNGQDVAPTSAWLNELPYSTTIQRCLGVLVFLWLILFMSQPETTSPDSEVQPRQVSFNETEYVPYVKEGTASIHGRVLLKTQGAGQAVVLHPVTSYTREWWEQTVVGGQRLAPPDPRALTYSRRTVIDDDGWFRFDRLPPGEYYVAGSMEDGWAGHQVRLRKRVTFTLAPVTKKAASAFRRGDHVLELYRLEWFKRERQPV